MTSFAFSNGETAVLHRQAVTGRDADNNDALGSQDTTIDGAVFVPEGSIETVGDRDTILDQPQVFLPSGTAVDGIDAITIRGRRYEVDGTPQSYQYPFANWSVPVVVKLRGGTG